jgi:thioredoxin reductase (NADPH)
MIGARPHTSWLADTLRCDDRGFILTGTDLIQDGAPRLGPDTRTAADETSVPGVFAVGDVRHGSVKRVASAVGAGSIASSSPTSSSPRAATPAKCSSADYTSSYGTRD